MTDLIEMLSGNDGLSFLAQAYTMFVNATVNQLKIDAAIITNVANTEISSISLGVVGDATYNNVNYTVQAGANVAFSNYDATVITLPTINSTDIDNLDIVYDFEDLTANTPYVIDVYLGEQDITFYTENTADENVTLIYDAETQKLTLSAGTVDYIISQGSIHFIHATLDTNIYLND